MLVQSRRLIQTKVSYSLRDWNNLDYFLRKCSLSGPVWNFNLYLRSFLTSGVPSVARLPLTSSFTYPAFIFPTSACLFLRSHGDIQLLGILDFCSAGGEMGDLTSMSVQLNPLLEEVTKVTNHSMAVLVPDTQQWSWYLPKWPLQYWKMRKKKSHLIRSLHY